MGCFSVLFESFGEAITYPSLVLLQDPPVNKAHLQSFKGSKSFFPPVRKPGLAAYIHESFRALFLVLPRFKGVDDILARDVSFKEPLFTTNFHCFRLINFYSPNPRNYRVHSGSPETMFHTLDVPLLVVGDLNIHNPLADPLRSCSPREIESSTPYFAKAAEAGFALLNPPGESTRFPLVVKARPSVIDLAFANPLLLPMFKNREVSRPWTGYDHLPIMINLAPPTLIPSRRSPRWSDMDWETLSPVNKNLRIPPAPPCPSLIDLDKWLAGSLDRLTALLKEHTPVSTPSHYSKPWWTPHLTTLSRVFHKASRVARKHGTPALQDVANISKAAYFKAIKTAKNKHWSSFLLRATPQTLWMAKRFPYGRAPSPFPSLPGAETPQQMNEVLLDYFPPSKEPFSPPPQTTA